ncbi:MAG: hypothetical protein AB1Z31_17030 [Desulfobacterales bacterium]
MKFVVLGGMLLGLPLLGVYLAGYPLNRYLEFPPKTQYIEHAPFSWPAFTVLTFVILAVVLPLAHQGIQAYKKRPQKTAVSTPKVFPWWGWTGVIVGSSAWILAWTRFSWFIPYQPHTFSPLWFSYIVVVNALCVRQTGHCLMTDRPGFFLLLFPVSAVFWWFFEFLNRFVQNWYYTGAEFSPWAYFWYATLPFTTVLPAVLSTKQWLQSANWIKHCFGDMSPIRFRHPRKAAVCILLLSAAGLAGIGVGPNFLFPLLWISPLLILASLQTLMKERHIFSVIAAGDWHGAVAAALAALVCGFFWEMWNYFSLAKWTYSVPLVHRFLIFEMPLLGYGGYLPFGLECMVIGAMLEKLFNSNHRSGTISN